MKQSDFDCFLFLEGDSFSDQIKSFIEKHLFLKMPDLITFFVHLACAVLIIACITVWVWKPTNEFIDSNKQKLDKERNDLLLNNRETKHFLGLLKKEKIRISSVRREIEIAAQDEAEKIISRAKKEAQEFGESIRKETEHKIKVMEDKAKEKIKGAVVQLSMELTEKLIEANLNDKNNKALIDSYIKSLEEKSLSSTKLT